MTGEELGLKILKSLQHLNAGQFRVTYSPVTAARAMLAMIQEDSSPCKPIKSEFIAFCGALNIWIQRCRRQAAEPLRLFC